MSLLGSNFDSDKEYVIIGWQTYVKQSRYPIGVLREGPEQGTTQKLGNLASTARFQSRPLERFKIRAPCRNARNPMEADNALPYLDSIILTCINAQSIDHQSLLTTMHDGNPT